MLVGFRVDVMGERQVSTSLLDLEDGMRDLSAPLRVIGDNIVDGIRGQFETEGVRGLGRRWVKLSDPYREWKQRNYPGRKMLVRTGGMKGALLDKRANLRVTDRRVVYEPRGPRAEIAARHQAGDGPPRRKIVAVTGMDARAMERTFAHWIRYRQGRTTAWPPPSA